jgi:hypothetical protein
MSCYGFVGSGYITHKINRCQTHLVFVKADKVRRCLCRSQCHEKRTRRQIQPSATPLTSPRLLHGDGFGLVDSRHGD